MSTTSILLGGPDEKYMGRDPWGTPRCALPTMRKCFIKHQLVSEARSYHGTQLNITDIMLGFLTHSSHMKTRSLKSLHWATFHIGASGSVKLASSITASVFPLYSCNWGQDVASWTCACTRPQLQHSILEVISTWSELYGFVLFVFVCVGVFLFVLVGI